MRNVPREIIGDGRHSAPQKVLKDMKADMVMSMALEMDLNMIHEAFPAAREIAAWWKVHSSAHAMAKLVMKTHGYYWSETTNISVMCVAIGLMMVMRKYKKLEEKDPVREADDL